MHHFPFSFIGMAVEARGFRRAQDERSQDDDGDKNYREQLPSHNVKLYRKPTLKSTEKLGYAKHVAKHPVVRQKKGCRDQHRMTSISLNSIDILSGYLYYRGQRGWRDRAGADLSQILLP